MIKIAHVITCLEPGGAENMLYRLLEKTDRRRFEPSVISMMGVGSLGERIQRELGIPVRGLGLGRGIPNPATLFRLASWLREDKISIVGTWMYHANLIGSLAAKLAGGIPVVWGLHHSKLDASIERRRTVWIAKLCGAMSRGFAGRIVCCSHSTVLNHLRLGYDSQKMVMIPNGFDTSAYRPDPAARAQVRRELGIAADAPVAILPARFHAQKDHRNFVRASALVSQSIPEVRFVLCGEGVTLDNPSLAGWIREEGTGERTLVLGRRTDMPRLMAASDIACLSSAEGEAFPLVIGEAMAAGVPCAVTDLGDSAEMVGSTGRVVPPRDHRALAGAMTEMLSMPAESRAALGVAARERIATNYELSDVTRRYEDLYLETLAGRGDTGMPVSGLPDGAGGRS